uniref:Uncharacterized protein n=1 Tax=Arundo donax TaxID=35708 RepID=A0A0A9HQ15_ARUDO
MCAKCLIQCVNDNTIGCKQFNSSLLTASLFSGCIFAWHSFVHSWFSQEFCTW